jgi:hypothetical protein
MSEGGHKVKGLMTVLVLAAMVAAHTSDIEYSAPDTNITGLAAESENYLWTATDDTITRWVDWSTGLSRPTWGAIKAGFGTAEGQRGTTPMEALVSRGRI